MGSEFKHSVKVPTQYRRTAAVLKTALERKKSLKNLIFEEKHASVRRMQAVLKRYTENRGAIDSAIEQTKILEENPRLDPSLCKVLVTELIFGRKQLNGESRPVQTVRSYQERLQNILTGSGEISDSTVAANKKDVGKPRYVRINQNLLSIADALEMLAGEEWRHKKNDTSFESYAEFLEAIRNLEKDEFMIDMHVADLLIFHASQRYYWACHAYVKEKKFMLQDKGTCLVPELLQPTPGSVLLDLCAAPGMKTIHACNIMQNRGTIYAVEQNFDRYKLLCNMTTSAKCDIVQTMHCDALTVDSTMCPDVDYILVDPSCSGSGMPRMSLDSDVKDEARLKKLAGLQIKMLLHAMQNFASVKRIAYSTCSLYEEENEQVIQRCLEQNPQFKLLSCKKALRNKWQNVGNTNYAKIGKNCIYTRPEEDLSDGIFIAIFEKRREE